MFSNSSKYAINAVLYLAVHSSESNKISVKEIAEKLSIPPPFLAKILQTLARKKAINSTKGPGGGFWISDEEKEAPLISIIEHIDELHRFMTCSMSLKGCSEEEPCPIHYAIKPFKDELRKQLSENSIAFFANKINNGEAFLFV
ncbi:RrF2 family transcriptional regulator [Capnocytophaga stomatis]|uniref:Transcriptional regulator n=1 Tax=Capnocytophaga stomatis TaxID=1848904 RepID=A0A250G0X7_9FLAO|nr:Rrf2 family transcriptional regulator [Capnocytophaga stomatis]ATA89857.1 transcriptional regulator [Capnocytophaga stomatis]GIJ93798.1 putative HTH-type transcriptional regulator [Capnocytophaga stomatis]GIJ95966.1 putative HTH-type transcriptional regulator [Capnocytophaga stomatis]GIM49822.1 putative HTH-type transcriptional regulator [Capnocytophaga stomatis]